MEWSINVSRETGPRICALPHRTPCWLVAQVRTQKGRRIRPPAGDRCAVVTPAAGLHPRPCKSACDVAIRRCDCAVVVIAMLVDLDADRMPSFRPRVHRLRLDGSASPRRGSARSYGLPFPGGRAGRGCAMRPHSSMPVRSRGSDSLRRGCCLAAVQARRSHSRTSERLLYRCQSLRGHPLLCAAESAIRRRCCVVWPRG